MHRPPQTNQPWQKYYNEEFLRYSRDCKNTWQIKTWVYVNPLLSDITNEFVNVSFEQVLSSSNYVWF